LKSDDDIFYLNPIGIVGIEKMKISTKGRYGLKAMIDLAVHATDGHVALKQVAERQNISERYLEQVFSLLRKGGVLKSIKGPQGGYLLDCDPKTTTMGDLLRILEGELTVQDTKEDKDPAEKCINEIVWKAIDQSFNDTINGITLETLVEEYRKETDTKAYMFYI